MSVLPPVPRQEREQDRGQSRRKGARLRRGREGHFGRGLDASSASSKGLLGETSGRANRVSRKLCTCYEARTVAV